MEAWIWQLGFYFTGPFTAHVFFQSHSKKRKLATNRRGHLADNGVLPHQLPVTQTQNAGMRRRLSICHHFTICNVLRVSLGDQQGLVGSEEEISASKRAAVLVIHCFN